MASETEALPREYLQASNYKWEWPVFHLQLGHILLLADKGAGGGLEEGVDKEE